ncbi:MAG: dihydrolipoamide acetyltransferase family protein [Candidatus Dormibacteria bacterium]
MPQLGESVTEGTISRWLVGPGDPVAELDALVEINTDKVDAEVPAPVTGVLTEILAPEGAVVPIGGNIAVLEVAETEHAVVPTDAGSTGTSSGHSPPLTGAKGRATPPLDADAPRSDSADGPLDGAPLPRDAAWTGPPTALEGDEDVQLTPVRRRIAENTALSKATIPHAWQMQEVDMTGVALSIAAHRGAVRRQHDASLTYLPYVVAAVAASLRSHPTVNSTFAKDHIVIHHEINLGIAVGLPDGVIVPVIRGADRMSIAELAIAVTDLTTRAREKQLTTSDLAGATMTVNNSGTLGTLLSYSVITPGQSAIVTMGSVMERPIAVDGHAVVRTMMYLSLSLDHRVMDGLEASAFLGACRQSLEAVTPSTPIS